MKKGEQTRQRILEAGVIIAEKGLHRCTSRAIGKALDMSHVNVFYYFKSTAKLQNAIAEFAVQHNCKRVVTQLTAIDFFSNRLIINSTSDL